MSQQRSSRRRSTRVVLSFGGVLFGVLGLMQFARFVVPDFKLDNPPSTQTIAWDSPETQQLFQRACADCHSNDTVYPWYAYIAPVGWLVAHDTHEGRDAMNISTDRFIEWDEMVGEIRRNAMPPQLYRSIHADANLTDAEKTALMDGLRATFG